MADVLPFVKETQSGGVSPSTSPHSGHSRRSRKASASSPRRHCFERSVRQAAIKAFDFEGEVRKVAQVVIREAIKRDIERAVVQAMPTRMEMNQIVKDGILNALGSPAQ